MARFQGPVAGDTRLATAALRSAAATDLIANAPQPRRGNRHGATAPDMSAGAERGEGPGGEGDVEDRIDM